MSAAAFPVVVILHDAWHTPTHYGRLIDMLTAQGFPTACPQLLTSHTEQNCTSSFNDDCSMIYQLVFDLASDGHDIIVIAHGYGSFVASECLCELSRQVRANMDKDGGVVELISLAGFLPEHGQTLKDCFGGDWPDFIKQQSDGTLMLYKPDAVLFNDVGPMERDHWASHLVRFNARADDIVLTTGSPAWKYIHTTYAICGKDLLYTEDLRRKALESTAIKSRPLPEVEFLKDTGHCAMIGGPEKILAIVMTVAERGRAETYDGTNEEDVQESYQCANAPVFGDAFALDRGSTLDISNTDNHVPDQPYQPCVCDGKCVCHHEDNCPLKAKYSTMNPDCPCSYGEYYRRVSTVDTSEGTSATDPLSSNYSGNTFSKELAAFESRDPYESWDSGLATIGSVEMTVQLNEHEIEEISHDDTSIRPGMRRSQSATPETATSEDGSDNQSRDDTFVSKMVRKTTTLPM